MPPSLFFSHVQLLVVAIFWGATWPAGSIVAANLPAFSSAAWRFLLASILMLIWVKLRQYHNAKRGIKPLKLAANQWLAIIFSGFLGVTLYATFFMLALQLIPSGRAALFITLTPVVITLLAVWWFHEPFNKLILIGIIVAVLGAVLVISHGKLSTFTIGAGGLGLGELYLVVCVLSWAGYSLMGKVIMRYGDSFTITTYSIIAGTLLLLPIAWFVDGFFPDLSIPNNELKKVSEVWQVWAALAFLSLAGTVLAYAWFFRAVSTAGAGTAASYISLVPVFGVFFSWLILDEPLDWTIWFGGGLAMIGVFMIAWSKAKLTAQN